MSTAALMERPAAVAIAPDELDLVRKTVANGATDAELKLFLFDCQRRGVHPLDKLLHFTKRGGKYTPVTSIDFMRSQAAMTNEMAGSDDAVFVEGDGHPVSATVTVYRMTQGQRFAYTATARWEEYCPDNAPMWRRMGHTMLAKCAEALALRKAFPQQLAGLYSREEMDQADVQTPAVSASVSGAVRFGAPTQSAGDSERRPSGAEALPDAAPSGDAIPVDHAEPGAVLEPPPGYYRVIEYRFHNGWHEATLPNYDLSGGPLHVSTKTKTGLKLKEAADTGQFVSVEVQPKNPRYPGEAYVNAVNFLGPAQKAF